jgi:hypothetical protein
LDCPYRLRFMHFHSCWKNLVNSVIGVAGFGFDFGAWQVWLWVWMGERVVLLWSGSK